MAIITFMLIITAIIATGALYVALSPAIYKLKTDDLIYDSSTAAHFGTSWGYMYDIFHYGILIAPIGAALIYIVFRQQREGVFP